MPAAPWSSSATRASERSAGRRGTPALILHDGQGDFAVVDLLADGLDEIPTARAEEPGGADHERGGQAQRGFLALALGEAVGGKRRRGVLFLIRQALRAVEDEVRGHLQEARPVDRALGRQQLDAHRVDLERSRVGLAGVHLRERRAVDDDLRARVPEGARHCRRARDVQVRLRPREDLAARSRQRRRERRSQHPRGARHQHPLAQLRHRPRRGEDLGERFQRSDGGLAHEALPQPGSFAVTVDVASRSAYCVL